MSALLELAVWLKIALGLIVLAVVALNLLVGYVVWDAVRFAWKHRRR